MNRQPTTAEWTEIRKKYHGKRVISATFDQDNILHVSLARTIKRPSYRFKREKKNVDREPTEEMSTVS